MYCFYSRKCCLFVNSVLVLLTYNPKVVSMYALLNPELRLKDNLA